MSNILDIIVAAKKKEVAEMKKKFHPGDSGYSSFAERKIFSLKENLHKTGNTGIIAEFKRKSPSKGWFKPGSYPITDVVKGYEKHGAVCASVLTDKEFFGGSKADLVAARTAIGIPLLRKDFIIDEAQLYESRAIGADVILLIAAILTPAEVKLLASRARELGMEVLLELHAEEELEHICSDTELIGINNRDLKTFKVDIERSLRMAEQLPLNYTRIAESGISSADDIILFMQHGFQGFLIGEQFMKADDPTVAFADFVKHFKAKAHED